MNMTQKLIVTLVLALACSPAANAQIFSESFESAPGATYTLTTAFDDGGFDYFGRYSVPDNTNGARDDFQIGWDGVWGIHSQDNDAEGGPATAFIDIFGINVSGQTGLSAIISLGALASEAVGFDNYEAVDGDGIQVFASLDGAPQFLIGAFLPPAVGTNSMTAAGDLYLDLSLIHISEPTRPERISYAVFCLK